jgi:N-acetylmuramic acid 6-phosphate etherase
LQISRQIDIRASTLGETNGQRIKGLDQAHSKLQSVEGAEDAVDQAIRLVQQHNIGVNDVLIAVAASGTTPFTVSCLTEARRRGALTIGIANNRDTPILQKADYPVWLDTGAEPIAGSTRMKAGTAQRITLNIFSSLVMILLGRVYNGLMVDLQAGNKKLVQRSERILKLLTGCSSEQACEALRQANGNLKLAVLLLHGCDFRGSRSRGRTATCSTHRHR